MLSEENPYAIYNSLTEEQQEKYDNYERSFDNWAEKNENRPCRVDMYPERTSTPIHHLKDLLEYFDLEYVFSASQGEVVDVKVEEDSFGIYWKNYYESNINSVKFELMSGDRIGKIDTFDNLISLGNSEVIPAKGWKIGMICGGYETIREQTLAKKDSRWENIDDLEPFYRFIDEQSSYRNLTNNISFFGEGDQEQNELDAIFVRDEFAEVFQQAVTAFLDKLEASVKHC